MRLAPGGWKFRPYSPIREGLSARARLQPGVGLSVLALQAMTCGPPLVVPPVSTAWLEAHPLRLALSIWITPGKVR